MKENNIYRSDEYPANGRGSRDPMPPRAHMYDYLMVVARYRWTVLSIILGGGILITIYLFLARQTFVAGATLLPPDKSEGISLTALVQSSSKLDFNALSENSSAENFVRILQSRTLGDSLINRFDLLRRFEIPESNRQLAIDEVIGNLSVSADRQGFIDISYAASTGFLPDAKEQREAADLAAKIVNASVEILDKLNQQKSVSRARRSREFIGRMREVKRAELDSVQAELLAFQQRNKAIALDKQVEASVEGLISLQTEIQKTELQLLAAQQEMAPDAPMVQLLRRQLAQQRAQKTRLEGGSAGGEALGIPLKGVPSLMRQLANLKLSLEVATQIYTYLEAQYNHEQIQEARELPTVSVMDYATPPERRTSPRRTLVLAVGLAGLTVFALLLAFIADSYRRSWEGVEYSKRAKLRETLGMKPRRESTPDVSR